MRRRRRSRRRRRRRRLSPPQQILPLRSSEGAAWPCISNCDLCFVCTNIIFCQRVIKDCFSFSKFISQTFVFGRFSVVLKSTCVSLAILCAWKAIRKHFHAHKEWMMPADSNAWHVERHEDEVKSVEIPASVTLNVLRSFKIWQHYDLNSKLGGWTNLSES